MASKRFVLEFILDTAPNLIGKTIVHCHGVFDVLHIGHLQYLRAAKKYGDCLVVTITSDEYVNKGPGRPYFNENIRAEMIAALDCVDYVAISNYSNATPAINYIRPHFYVKGPDYKNLNDDPTGNIFNEKREVEYHGGKLVFTNEEIFSSSALINRFFAPWTEEQKKAIEEVRGLGGMALIKTELEQISKELSVVVVGELIWDKYVFVKPQGISSKSPSISANLSYTEKYKGGAWAIAKHIESFCQVSLVSSGIQHTKTRYISEDTGQRLLEITNHPEEATPISPHPWPKHNLCVVADFGHGLITQNNIQSEAFRALNVQTNSSNYGFNVFTKHQEWDYLVLDQREIRLAYNDRKTSAIDLGMRAHGFNAAPVGLTMGPQGSSLFFNGQAYSCPAFADTIVDTIGAGDAYFALTSLLVRVNAHPVIINFLGNVFAGLKTKIIGNKASVTKVELLKTCEAILKV